VTLTAGLCLSIVSPSLRHQHGRHQQAQERRNLHGPEETDPLALSRFVARSLFAFVRPESDAIDISFSVLAATTKSLCNIKGLSEAKVEKIREAAKSKGGASFM
jgi:hypothetical protein